MSLDAFTTYVMRFNCYLGMHDSTLSCHCLSGNWLTDANYLDRQFLNTAITAFTCFPCADYFANDGLETIAKRSVSPAKHSIA